MTDASAIVDVAKDLRGMMRRLQPSSLITALHSRYEAAWEEYNSIDLAQPCVEEDHREYYRCADGMKRNAEETTLIRNLIMRQVPNSDEELTILAFHAWGLSDVGNMPEADQETIEVAINNIFDYLVSENRADMDLGKQFAAGALLAFHRRRYSTGLPEDD